MIHIRYCEVCKKAYDIGECPYCREKNKLEVGDDGQSNK